MEAGLSVASVAVRVVLPGGEILFELVKEIWILYQQIKETNGFGPVCEALCMRVELLAQRLAIDRAKLEDNGAIATVIDSYLKTVNDFKNCLVGWIKYVKDHRLQKLWKLNDVPDKIEGFHKAINVLHEELDRAHIIEMEKWRRTDSRWKEQLKHELAHLGNQVTEEHDKTKEHVTEEHDKTKEHVTAELNSLREGIQPKKKDIEHLIQNLKNASDEKKDQRSNELWDQCNRAKKNDAIPGLLALVEYCRSDKRLLAAHKLSRLAKTQNHLEAIVAKGGVEQLIELACEGYPDQIMQIETTLGVLHYFSKDDANQVGEEIVQSLLLVLRESTIPEARMMAAGVLDKLSRSKTGMKEIADHGGISALVNTICVSSSNSVDRQRKTYAVDALKNLSKSTTYQREVAEAIPKLITLIKLIKLPEKPEAVQRDSVLVILGILPKNFRAEIVDAGGIRWLRKLLTDGYDTKTNQAKQYAVRALELLSSLVEDPPSKDSSGASLGPSQFGVDRLLADYRGKRREMYSTQEAADSSYSSYQCWIQIKAAHKKR